MANLLAATGVGGAAGGGLPPDNGFGLMSLTTTKSGIFQANIVFKTGAVLRWWWGDGTYSDGNNPAKAYPDSSEKTIYIATSDGWSGVTDLRCFSAELTNSNVTVTTSLTILQLSDNNLASPPDVSNNTSLSQLQLHNNNLASPPDVSNNTSLTILFLYNNNLASPPDVSNNTSLSQLQLHNNNLVSPPDVSNNTSLTRLFLHSNNLASPPDVSNNTSLTRLFLHSNNFNASSLATIIDDCYANRVVLGGNACDIQIQGNAEPPNADTIAKIEGTGIYAGDGLKDNGCTVSY